jgi:putative membrane protein
MRRAADFFGAEERRLIEAAVTRAEEKTTAEIVPVVASASGRYDRAEDIIGLWVGVVLMAKVWWFFPRGEEGAMWDAPWQGLLLPSLIAAVLVGFVLGAKVASVWHGLRYFFIPGAEMRAEVLSSARRAFYEHGAHHTTAGTGIVVYISLSERLAALVADETVLQKLGQPVLDNLAAYLAKGIREGEAPETMKQVIDTLGEQLADVLPRAADDVNEVSNRLVVLE